MKPSLYEHLTALLRWTARPVVFFYLLIPLMFLLVVGTIAQKYIGLYLAHKLFFASFVIWMWGVIPLPGGYTIMTLIFINLLSKLIHEPWTKSKIGTLTTHCGALLLILGGGLTAAFSSEGFVLIDEGSSSSYIEDYRQHELAIVDSKKIEVVFNHAQLQSNTPLRSSLPFTISVEQQCDNCAITQRSTALQDGSVHGMLVANEMRGIPLSPDDGKNLSGIIFNITGADKKTDGRYALIQDSPITQHLKVKGKTYTVEFRRQRTALPFSIKLIKFEKQLYPGTDKPREYQSEVILTDGSVQWHSLISMNSPLRYKGYTFYQSSFLEKEGQNATILAAVKNIGAVFPYISSIILCCGLLMHLFARIPKLKMKKLAITLFILGCLTTPAHANDLDYQNFSEVPILHEGRIKPLSSFARAYLLAFSGQSSLPEMSASAWLAELLFTPEKSFERPVFNIANPDVVNALGLPLHQHHRYSYLEISRAFETYGKTLQSILDMDEAKRTPSQHQMVELYSKVTAYILISQSLSLIQPRFQIHTAKLAQDLNVKSGEDLTFLDLLPSENYILAAAEDFKHTKPTQLDKAQRERAFLVLDYLHISKHQQSSLLRIVPPQWTNDSDTWQSPWTSLMQGHGSPQSAAYIDLWKQMVTAFQHKDVLSWKTLSAQARNQAFELAQDKALAFRVKLEAFYIKTNFITLTLALYFLAFAFLFMYFIANRPSLYTAAFTSLCLGLALHAAAIIMRIIIMDRPPVATLYETTLFVSFIAVFLSLVFERKRQDTTSLIVGALIGTVLLFISTRYAADGDTMEMLVAVLNTNFWLATHVIAITTGYGCALVAGTLGHIYLISRWTKPRDPAFHTNLINTILAVALIAAFFSLLGTILGGIWADQSWGRFWGWDPKENGAMLIVLWLLWLLHGKIAKVLSPLNFASIAVLTNVVVALSWFGVNLLNVGLHSYGFTNNIAAGLIGFCGTEIAFVLAMRLLLMGKAKA
ncbi:MAG: cytochrome c biogenesis protein CcsA [Alphaproteobacteria bacterium]